MWGAHNRSSLANWTAVDAKYLQETGSVRSVTAAVDVSAVAECVKRTT